MSNRLAGMIVHDGKILDFKDTLAVLAEAEPYYCDKCSKIHGRTAKSHDAHLQYARKIYKEAK